jgi:hypothetical protein
MIRRVAPSTWLATSRSGVVQRVRDAGPAWRLPLLERWVSGPSGPVARPLVVRGQTADGVRVLVVAQAVVRLPRPAPGTSYVDPWPAAERAAEGALSRALQGIPVAEVTGEVLELARRLRHVASAAVDAFGVLLLDLELVEVGLPVEPTAENETEEKSPARGAR